MVYLLIAFYILFGVLAFKNFKLALYFVFLLLPTYRVQFEVFNLPFNLLSGLIWLLVLVFFLKHIKEVPNLFRNFKEKFKNKDNIFGSFRWPIILIIISAYLATFFVKDSMGALGLFKAYFLEAIFFFVLLVFNFTPSVTSVTSPPRTGGENSGFEGCVYMLQALVFLIFGAALFSYHFAQ